MVSRSAPFLIAAALAAVLPPAGAEPVPTITVGAASATAGFTIEGTLQAQQQASIAALASGRVLQLAVKAGERVKAGQLLARIDDRELQAGVAAGDAGVAQAQAALLQAQQHATRTRDLRAQGFVSAAALDAALAQLQAAEAAVRQAQAGSAQAGIARGHATVTAPFDGIVLATLAEAGDLATPGRPLLTLYAPGRLRAVVQLPASRSAAARGATQVALLLPDGTRLVADKRTELPVLDAGSQTIEWRFDLSAADSARLQPGLPVQVSFSGVPAAAAATGPTAPRVPAGAVLQRGELTAVYAVQGDRFVLKAVRTGARQGDQLPVLAGLKAGERIAADPVRAGLAGATPAR